jgi:hypothetical protein
MKLCKVCNVEKCESDFNQRDNGKLRNECKECKKSYLKAYRKEVSDNPFTQNTKNKTEKTCNTCGETKSVTEFINQKRICKICKSAYLKKYYEENKESISEQTKLKYQESKEEKKERSRNYSKNNREKVNRYRRKYKENVLKKNPLYSVIVSISNNIRRILKKISEVKDFKTLSIIGCSKVELKLHIESLFLENMNWENRDKWHIDHIIPISLAKNKHEVEILNHYSNLRPMWSYDNIVKSNKIEDEKHPIYLKLLEFRNQDLLP